MAREVVFDTETTGISPVDHRICEFAGVELIDRLPTGKVLQFYVNPQRPMPPDAFRLHGLSTEFLKRKPVFARQAQRMLDFFGDSRIVAHNIKFDIGHIDAELARLGLPPLANPRLDTLAMSRAANPGGRHSLDALLSRYKIDASARVKHGALIDTQLLAKAYYFLSGPKQVSFDLKPDAVEWTAPIYPRRIMPPGVTDAEKAAHAAFLAADVKGSLWGQYDTPAIENAA